MVFLLLTKLTHWYCTNDGVFTGTSDGVGDGDGTRDNDENGDGTRDDDSNNDGDGADADAGTGAMKVDRGK